MRKSILAALAFAVVLAVPVCASASPAASAAPLPAPHVIRPADGPSSNIVARPHLKTSAALDLVGWVDVKGERAGKPAAVQALKQKAIAMGADGIANVEFHRGRGGAPGHFTASAVMLRKRHAHAAHPAPAAPVAPPHLAPPTH